MSEIQTLKKALEKKPLVIGNESKIPSFAVYSDTEICGFFGKYRFLSNFWKCPNGVLYMGTLFPSTEHAYQASKHPKEKHESMVHVSAAEVKKLGQEAVLPKDWERNKTDIMANLVYSKFKNDVNLGEKLITTGNKHLEERNYWGDVFWGTNEKGFGENQLGKILMQVRAMIGQI